MEGALLFLSFQSLLRRLETEKEKAGRQAGSLLVLPRGHLIRREGGPHGPEPRSSCSRPRTGGNGPSLGAAVVSISSPCGHTEGSSFLTSAGCSGYTELFYRKHRESEWLSYKWFS